MRYLVALCIPGYLFVQFDLWSALGACYLFGFLLVTAIGFWPRRKCETSNYELSEDS